MALEDSEFGGHSGLIQPPPHDTKASAREQAFLERAVAPDDETDSPAAVLADVLSGRYPRLPLPEAAEILPLQPDVMLVQAVPNPGIGFGVVVVGNVDLRTARLKVASQPTMNPAEYGPEKEVNPSIAPVVALDVGGLIPGHYYYQVLMNNLQVSPVWEVDVV